MYNLTCQNSFKNGKFKWSKQVQVLYTGLPSMLHAQVVNTTHASTGTRVHAYWNQDFHHIRSTSVYAPVLQIQIHMNRISLFTEHVCVQQAQVSQCNGPIMSVILTHTRPLVIITLGSTPLQERVVITQANTSWMFSHTRLDHKFKSQDEISSPYFLSFLLITQLQLHTAPSILLLLSGLWLSPDNYWGNTATRAKSWRRCLG